MKAARIAEVLEQVPLTFVTEDDLQREIADHLTVEGIPNHREVRLSDGVSRVDLLAGATAVEVKIDGTWKAATRQLLRYAKCGEVHELVLVTTRAAHRLVPGFLNEKPVHVVLLRGGAI